MIIKVVLGTMQNAKKLVNIAESISYDVELCNGSYVVNAKSMLGVLSLPDFDIGELHIHTDNEKECEKILCQLSEENLLADVEESFCRSIYDITGDSFWGGFLYKISTSEKKPEELTIKELAEYTRFGNAVASLCVEKRGAIPAMPGLSQVEERLEGGR